VDPKELEVAKTLASALAAEDFDLAEYADKYKENVRRLIESKVKGKEAIRPSGGGGADGSNQPDGRAAKERGGGEEVRRGPPGAARRTRLRRPLEGAAQAKDVLDSRSVEDAPEKSHTGERRRRVRGFAVSGLLVKSRFSKQNLVGQVETSSAKQL
jgi:hypothetical protein